MNEYLKQNISVKTHQIHLQNINKLGDAIDYTIDKLIEHMRQTYTSTEQFKFGKTILKVIKYKITQNELTQDDYDTFNIYFKENRLDVEQNQIMNTRQIKRKLSDGAVKTANQLYSQLDVYYENDQYKHFVINFLLMYYHVRNLDLDLIITDNPDDVDETNNFLLVERNRITYTRNQYKTFHLYGKKTYEIRDKRFVYAVSQLEKGRLLKTQNIAQELKRYIVDNMTEATINKILIAEMNLNQLKHASESRGTSLEVLYKYYNINI